MHSINIKIIPNEPATLVPIGVGFGSLPSNLPDPWHSVCSKMPAAKHMMEEDAEGTNPADGPEMNTYGGRLRPRANGDHLRPIQREVHPKAKPARDLAAQREGTVGSWAQPREGALPRPSPERRTGRHVIGGHAFVKLEGNAAEAGEGPATDHTDQEGAQQYSGRQASVTEDSHQAGPRGLGGGTPLRVPSRQLPGSPAVRSPATRRQRLDTPGRAQATGESAAVVPLTGLGEMAAYPADRNLARRGLFGRATWTTSGEPAMAPTDEDGRTTGPQPWAAGASRRPAQGLSQLELCYQILSQHGLAGLLTAHAAGILDVDDDPHTVGRGSIAVGGWQGFEPRAVRGFTPHGGRQAARPTGPPADEDPGVGAAERGGHPTAAAAGWPHANLAAPPPSGSGHQLGPAIVGPLENSTQHAVVAAGALGLDSYGLQLAPMGDPHATAIPALSQGYPSQGAVPAGLPLPGGKLLLGNVLFGPVEIDACGRSSRRIERMPELRHLQPPATGLGGNPGRLAAQAAAAMLQRHREQLLQARPDTDGTTHTHYLADAIVGAVLMSLGAAAPWTEIASAVEAVIWGAAEPLIHDLRTTLAGPLGLTYAERVADRLEGKVRELMKPLAAYSASYDADIDTVSHKLATLLGGLELVDCALELLAPHHMPPGTLQHAWLYAAESELNRSAVCSPSMTEEMWAKGFGPQLGCLWRLQECLGEVVKLLRTVLAAAKYENGLRVGESVGARISGSSRGGAAGGEQAAGARGRFGSGYGGGEGRHGGGRQVGAPAGRGKQGPAAW
ncbi:hypothetical protein VOLCADRAFT_92305 [Volvox carteri f. nagariensis]|uniref:Uncharacterized protein n=1 Tax=Volvox carteri f. nagariensis TaxID=3068 RepID=D8TZB3_VOLCA|nr:uncharacterized protein VOLCADRAFT_92305 [Volvox carteri f. nagariensis]EFJ47244.1 hypothetical protein VOLCADRAFT_92305 [Volvox carteri f. nagariensis]|eukprot:XP_002951793.1 hypothetical protein VOLCADRAFT_92305 [Volvox carteri f. nagariensis]